MLDAVIRNFYGDNPWANSPILDTAAHLTPQQPVAPGGASFGARL